MKTALNYLPATAAPKFSALLITFAGAHVLSAEELGFFAFVILVGEICEMTALAWTRIHLIKAGSGPRGLDAVTLREASIAAVPLSLLASLFAIAFINSSLDSWRSEMAIALFFYIISNSLLRLGLTSLQLAEKKKLYNIIEICRSIMQFFIVVTCFYYFRTFFIASVVGSIVALVLGTVALNYGWKAAKEGGETSSTEALSFKHGLPIVILTALAFTVSSLDRMLLSAHYTMDVLAKYALAYAIGRQGFDILSGAINTQNFPNFLRVAKTDGKKAAASHLHMTITMLISVLLPAAGALLAASQALTHAVLPTGYDNAVLAAMPLVIIGAISLNLKTFAFDNIFHAYDKNYQQIPTLCAGALAGAAAFKFFGFQDPYLTASFVFAISSLTSLLASIVLSARILRICLPFRSLFFAVTLMTCSFGLTRLLCSLQVWTPLQVGIAICCGLSSIALGSLMGKVVGQNR